VTKTPPETKKVALLARGFTGSAGDDAAGATSGSPDGHKPTDPTKPDGPKRKRRRDRDRDIDFER
jgi:hypothetical protein